MPDTLREKVAEIRAYLVWAIEHPFEFAAIALWSAVMATGVMLFLSLILSA